MTDVFAIEAMLIRWGEGPGGRTVTFLLPDDPGEHPFRGLKTGRVHGQRLAISIALIADDETQHKIKQRREWNELPPASQAALRCDDPVFRKFLESKGLTGDPAEQVRSICGVASRSQLSTDQEAMKKWLALDSEYQTWLRVA